MSLLIIIILLCLIDINKQIYNQYSVLFNNENAEKYKYYEMVRIDNFVKYYNYIYNKN